MGIGAENRRYIGVGIAGAGALLLLVAGVVFLFSYRVDNM